MKLIVEITDDNWKSIQDGTWCGSEAIAKGTPLEPCSDAISRQAALNEIEYHTLFWNTDDLRMAADVIRDLPSVHAEPRTGHWIFCKGDWRTCVDGHICSVCKTSYHTQVPYFAEYKYCPNCGAKMEADNA